MVNPGEQWELTAKETEAGQERRTQHTRPMGAPGQEFRRTLVCGGRFEGLQGNKKNTVLGGCLQGWRLFIWWSPCARHCSEYSACTNSFNPHFKAERTGPKEIKAQGHRANNCQIGNLNLGSLSAESTLQH